MIYAVLPVMGKSEGSGENWHGHVTCLSVAPNYRREQLAAKLMKYLEDISEMYANNNKT
jgi:N-terminal acetyltransferase B complex catalytic subunit